VSTKYTKHFATEMTPQSEPAPGKKQVKNNAGGFTFQLDDWGRLDRFLILGTEEGTYYSSEAKHTMQASDALLRCITVDGIKTVNRIVEISKNGQAPKNDPAVFALAMALKKGDVATRQAARAAVPQVCRIGTHIFQLAESIQAFGGWGSGTKKAFSQWYTTQEVDRLAMNLVKYQNRNGWSHADLLRQCHAKSALKDQNALFRWAIGSPMAEREIQRFKNWTKDSKEAIRTDKYQDLSDVALPKVVQGFELAKTATDAKTIVKLITEFGLPREAIPTQFLNDKSVWEALLMSGNGMPFTAMIRNLGKMSAIELIKPLSAASKYVVKRLQDEEGLKKARVHPLSILVAQSVYTGGQGIRGSLSWGAVPQVVDALNDAFYGSFKFVPPTGKRYLLALDVSGSMSGGSVAGAPLSPREASSAMAMVTARTEEDYAVMAFSTGFIPLDISPKQRLTDIVKKTQNLPFDGTDCALPMLYAGKKKLDVDVFVVYTDNETWSGNIHPHQALQQYRNQTGISAKLVVVGMTATEFTIADPNDAGMMDVVGFDTAAPSVMAQFATQT
jgi:60 kDa SS-A/Ro ribonucleoprotein